MPAIVCAPLKTDYPGFLPSRGISGAIPAASGDPRESLRSSRGLARRLLTSAYNNTGSEPLPTRKENSMSRTGIAGLPLAVVAAGLVALAPAQPGQPGQPAQ